MEERSRKCKGLTGVASTCDVDPAVCSTHSSVLSLPCDTFFAFLALFLGPVVGQNGIWVFLGPWICLDTPRDRKFILYQGRPGCPRNLLTLVPVMLALSLKWGSFLG